MKSKKCTILKKVNIKVNIETAVQTMTAISCVGGLRQQASTDD